MAQTEAAALKINERILAMASRAEHQAGRMGATLASLRSMPGLDHCSLEELRQTTDSVTASARDLALDVAQIVMALQYQDITKQQLQHVVQPLEHLKATLQALVRGEGAMDERAQGLLEALHQSYTMESERAIMAHALMGTAPIARSSGPAVGTNAEREDAGDVTLF